MQAEPAFSVSNAWELRFSGSPFIREVLVSKAEQLSYRQPSYRAVFCHGVNERSFSNNLVGKEIRLVCSHRSNSAVVPTKRYARVVVKCGDVFNKGAALAEQRAIQLKSLICNSARKLLQISALHLYYTDTVGVQHSCKTPNKTAPPQSA
jgi:hypothetical protein